MYCKVISSPIGPLTIVSDGTAITALRFGPDAAACSDIPLLHECEEQLDAYFSGSRKTFHLPLAPYGTEFQRQVWSALNTIPYGETRTYKDIATAIQRPNACRAVGMANHRNPLPILIPCHRIIGSNGSLTGYAGGLPAKKMLLSLEGSWSG